MQYTQPTRDVLGKSTEGFLTLGTSRGPPGDLQGTLRRPTKKIDDLMKKVFSDAIFFVLHTYYCFLLKKQIFICCKWGRPRYIYRTQLRDQMIGSFDDVPGTSLIYVFKIQLRNILNLLWQFTQAFIVNWGSETFGEQYSNLNNKN